MTDGVLVPLLRRDGSICAYSRVDSDATAVLERKWHLCTNGYARTTFPRGTKPRHWLMHKFIMRPPPGHEVDHVNGDKLDNRRENLRIVTKAQNMQNLRRPYRGATLDPRHGRWKARVTVNGREHWLGYHATREEAAEAARAFRALHMPYSAEDMAA